MKIINYKVTEIKDKVLKKGRCDFYGNGLALGWSGSGMSVNFRGSHFMLGVEPFSDINNAYLGVYVDGVKSIHSIVNGSEKIRIETAYGDHKLTVIRLSAGDVPVIINEIRVSSLACEDDPVLLEAPKPYNRRILFFGDSITCGFGVVSATTDPYQTFDEDVTDTYAFLTCNKLMAEHEIVSISGQGLVHACNGAVGTPFETFAFLKTRGYTDEWDYTPKPDIIVINGGTNDCPGNTTAEEMSAAMKKFVKKLRSKYEGVKILWIYGLMNDNLSDAIEKTVMSLNDEIGEVYYQKLELTAECERGGVDHPSYESSIKTADVLLNRIKELMNW